MFKRWSDADNAIWNVEASGRFLRTAATVLADPSLAQLPDSVTRYARVALIDSVVRMGSLAGSTWAIPGVSTVGDWTTLRSVDALECAKAWFTISLLDESISPVFKLDKSDQDEFVTLFQAMISPSRWIMDFFYFCANYMYLYKDTQYGGLGVWYYHIVQYLPLLVLFGERPYLFGGMSILSDRREADQHTDGTYVDLLTCLPGLDTRLVLGRVESFLHLERLVHLVRRGMALAMQAYGDMSPEHIIASCDYAGTILNNAPGIPLRDD